jgi:hypothetical protein
VCKCLCLLSYYYKVLSYVYLYYSHPTTCSLGRFLTSEHTKPMLRTQD